MRGQIRRWIPPMCIALFAGLGRRTRGALRRVLRPVKAVRRPLGLLALTAAVVLIALAGAALTHKYEDPPPDEGTNRESAASPSTDSACESRPVHGDSTILVLSAGSWYTVPVYLPESYDARHPVPVVLDLHGSNSNGRAQLALSGMRATADKYGFAVVAPDGGVRYPGSKTGYAWNIPGVPLFGGKSVPSGARDDVRFIKDTIDSLGDSLCVDSRRVYVTGFSGGARMTSLVGCRLSDEVAAIAPVSGIRAGLPDAAVAGGGPRPGDCVPSRTLPVITFHGLADKANPYAGDNTNRWRYSVRKAVDQWAYLDGCPKVAKTDKITAHVSRIAYANCRDNAQVVLYLASDAGHTWPGGPGKDDPYWGRIDHEISANELMWAFFSQYELPAAPSN